MGMGMEMDMEHMAKVTQVVGRVNIRTIRMGTMAMDTTPITDTQDTIIRMAQTVITTVATCIRYMSHLHNTVTVIIDKVFQFTKNIFIFYAINAK